MLMMINQHQHHDDDHLQQSRPGYSDPGRPSGCASLTCKHIGDKYDNDHIGDHDNDACDNDDMLPRYSNTLMLLTKMLMISKAMTEHNVNDDNIRKNWMTTTTMSTMITMMTI